MIRDWLVIATTIACLWGLWLLLQFVFDCIEDYHAAWREAQAGSEDRRSSRSGQRSSGSR